MFTWPFKMIHTELKNADIESLIFQDAKLIQKMYTMLELLAYQN